MSIISQDITSKKLLLVYCIDNMRDKFARIGTEINYKSPKEKERFNEIISILSSDYLLQKRIKVAIKNIEYLIKNEFIDVNFGKKLKHRLEEILLPKVDYYIEDIKEFISENEQHFVNEKIDIERFLWECKKKYLQLISIYQLFLNEENSLVEKVIDIWNKELTDCNTYIEGEEYKFLVYATKERAEDVINIVLDSNAVIHTSYITDKHAKVYQDREYGLIFDINKENLLFMSYEDNQTADLELSLNDYVFSMDKNYFFRENGIIAVQHITHNAGRTYIPERLLSDDYNEVDLINNKYTIPKAVFVFDDASDYWKSESQKLAEMLNLKLVQLRRN